MNKALYLAFFVIVLILSLFITAMPISAAQESDVWIQKAPMHQARAGLGVGVVNASVYAIGGSTQIIQGTPGMGPGITGDVTGTNEQYEPLTDTWSQRASMPTPRALFGIAIFENKIYCMGGITGSGPSNVNEVYDPITNTWAAKASMLSSGATQANVVGNKIYVLSTNFNSILIQVYDPVGDNWTSVTPWPDSTFRWSSTAFNDKIFVLGGLDPLASGARSNVIYNTDTDKWATGQSLSFSAIFGGAAVSTTGVLSSERIYLMGLGIRQPFVNGIYDPQLNSWAKGASLPSAVTNFGLAVVNDKLFLVGGDINGVYPDLSGSSENWAPSATNWQYNPLRYGTPDPSYSVEHTPPKISVGSPANQTYDSSRVSFNFSVDKTIDWLGYSLDGKLNTTLTGGNAMVENMTTTFTIANLTEGQHSLVIFANDTFGNMGQSENILFIVHLSHPFDFVLLSVIVGVVGVVIVVTFIFFCRKKRTKRFVD